MRGFFNDWRRKVGCVLLVTACLLMGAWIRSYSFEDSFWFVRGNKCHLINSDHSELAWLSFDESGGNKFYGWDSRKYSTDGIANLATQWPHDTQSWVVHYWQILLPLTLLSAWLLLWKPRKRRSEP